MVTKPHHLQGVKQSVDQRAKISASSQIKKKDNPEAWQLFYEAALKRIQAQELLENN